MNRPPIRARAAQILLALALVAAAGPLHAGVLFATAYKQYQDGDYAAARAGFRELAELGQPQAQGLLGQMLVKGLGGPADLGAGFGWMQASAGNGLAEALNQLDKIKNNIAKLSPTDQAAAAEILHRYRRASLEEALLPTPSDLAPCAHATPVQEFEIVVATYPATARRWGSDADVVVEVRVGSDGLPREPQILAWFAEADLFSDAALRSVMRSRFVPATREGRAVDGRYQTMIHFRLEGGGSLWNRAGVRQAAEMAARGNTDAEFLVGSGGTADPEVFGVSYLGAVTHLLHSAQDGHPQGQYRIGDVLRRSAVCEPVPKASHWIALAADNGDPSAQVTRARELLESEPASEARAEAKRLLLNAATSSSAYASRVAIGVLATSPLDDVRDPAAAMSAIRAVKTDDYAGDPLTWEAFAAAYAANGRTADAVTAEERALKLAREYRWNTAAISERLASYRQHQAWTGDLFALPPVPPPGPPPSDVPRCDARHRGADCLRIHKPAASAGGI